jgi:hypothetical protein
MANLAEFAVQTIVTVSGGGAVVAGLNAYISRRVTQANIDQTRAATGKTQAEVIDVGAGTAATQVDTSLDMLREMRIDLVAARDEAREARAEAKAARDEAHAAREEIDFLRGLLTAHGVTIPLRPPTST